MSGLLLLTLVRGEESAAIFRFYNLISNFIIITAFLEIDPIKEVAIIAIDRFYFGVGGIILGIAVHRFKSL